RTSRPAPAGRTVAGAPSRGLALDADLDGAAETLPLIDAHAHLPMFHRAGSRGSALRMNRATDLFPVPPGELSPARAWAHRPCYPSAPPVRPFCMDKPNPKVSDA